ncbi:hypothetical protein RW64_03305 [Geobacter sulfurreducens]|nr:hypothetical protein RW64_03305 [Geobacter sulfurreducens]
MIPHGRVRAAAKTKGPLPGNGKGPVRVGGHKLPLIAPFRAGFSTWRPLPDRLLWFHRAFPSTTLDKKVYYSLLVKDTEAPAGLSIGFCRQVAVSA